METSKLGKLERLLIANRGEIAVRIIETAKRLNVRTVSIYTPADAASLHVANADRAILLNGDQGYTDGDRIIQVAIEENCQAIIPGYGFLSENAAFAKSVSDAGLIWVGPNEEAIRSFGVKHVARDLAQQAGVPIVPGTKGLIKNADCAVQESISLGYPVMLKATAGGGGLGLVICNNDEEVRAGFSVVSSRGQALFRDSGLYIERYYPNSHHVEVQIFGNGVGSVVHFGERECSIQRRHQKVIEECPSPFVEKHPGLRDQLGQAAIKLAESINYGSAGTVEFLVDDGSAEFFFLEMNTRLQVEHPVTEMCYDIDLVELMLKQADAQLAGEHGLSTEVMASLQRESPVGVAIEARVYAENVVRDFAPSPGLLTEVHWEQLGGSRIDTWVRTGVKISPLYDPLIAKIINHAKTRRAARKGMELLLSRSTISGPPNNLSWLNALMTDEKFIAGQTLTSFLDSFEYVPSVIDVISAGAYTLIQDLPGRPTVGEGIPHSGAMDPVALSIGNMLVGNERGTEGLEITLSGPRLRFLGPSIIALTGAPMEASLDGSPFPQWTRKHIKAGQILDVGRTTGAGCRSYLAVYGGFPGVSEYFGSRSTSPVVAIGGYQGRQLAPGDQLALLPPPDNVGASLSLPESIRPQYDNDWEIMAMPGPHDEGYLSTKDIEMIYSTDWKVSHNASRSAIRLIGPIPEWGRSGGEGGSHPSNLIEYGYTIGALNWTGDDPCILPVDCPNFGGFVSSTTAIRSEWWKLGQMRAGDRLRYKRVSLQEAVTLRRNLKVYLDSIQHAIETGNFEEVVPLQTSFIPSQDFGKAIVWRRAAQAGRPQVTFRQAGDDCLLVEYGEERFDINYKCRIMTLAKALYGVAAPLWLKENLINTVSCCTSITLFFDGSKISRNQLVDYLQHLEDQIGDLRNSKISCRKFKLPLSFESKEQSMATKRYMETLRSQAPYLPSNLDFVAKNNAFTTEQLKRNMLDGVLLVVVTGFFCGNTVSLPVDPRLRMTCPKANPSRVFTPEGTLGWGGSCASIYPVDSPGGYQMLGRTIPCFDCYGWKDNFSPDKPWLFQDFDLLTFYEVSEDELDQELARFRSGRYAFKWEEAEFDTAKHNRLLDETANEVHEMRTAQAKIQEQMIQAENESLTRWRAGKERDKTDASAVESLLEDPNVMVIESPVDANVWKVEVQEADKVQAKQLIAILEAMKLEINVNAPDDLPPDSMIEKILTKPGEIVKAGERIALLRRVA